ncbi:MAG: hypothetical protein IJS37_00555 [Bacilli bacterium]|nr:hypothetical protein [Bacilli bacterium]
MNAKPTKAEVKRILGALKRSKKKFVNLDTLSRVVGLYPDVLADTLAYFEPMIRMDPSINVRDLEPLLREYLTEPMKPVAADKPKKATVSRKELAQYSSIPDFVFKKMTNVGGLVDTAVKLSDEDLLILDRLVQNEIKRRKKAEKNK